MSFFIRNKGSNKAKSVKGKKLKLSSKAAPKLSKSSINSVKSRGKQDEVTSSEDDDDEFGPTRHNNDNIANQAVDDESDVDETAQDKRLRLAKQYLKAIEAEEKRRLEDDVDDLEVDIRISKRLKADHLQQQGLYRTQIADKCTGYEADSVTLLRAKDHRQTVTVVCLTMDGKYMFSGSKDGCIVKWCLETLKRLTSIPFCKRSKNPAAVKPPGHITGHSHAIVALSVSTDGEFLASADNDKQKTLIHIWSVKSDQIKHVHSFSGHQKPVSGLAFRRQYLANEVNSSLSSSAQTLYSCAADRSVKVWSVGHQNEMQYVETLYGHQDPVMAIDALTKERAVTAGGRDGTVRLWKIAEESQLVFNVATGLTSQMMSRCCVDAVKMITEDCFVTGADDGNVCLWSIMKKKPVCTVKAAHGIDASNGQPHWIISLAAAVNTDMIASGSCNGEIVVWRLIDNHRKLDRMFAIPMVGFVNSLSFTPDRTKLVAAVGIDHRLGRWSVNKEAKNGVRVIPLSINLV